jgi:hypothetical protein
MGVCFVVLGGSVVGSYVTSVVCNVSWMAIWSGGRVVCWKDWNRRGAGVATGQGIAMPGGARAS